VIRKANGQKFLQPDIDQPSGWTFFEIFPDFDSIRFDSIWPLINNFFLPVHFFEFWILNLHPHLEALVDSRHILFGALKLHVSRTSVQRLVQEIADKFQEAKTTAPFLPRINIKTRLVLWTCAAAVIAEAPRDSVGRIRDFIDGKSISVLQGEKWNEQNYSDTPTTLV
jgi:hypothetical protein